MERPRMELNAVDGSDELAKHIVMIRYATYPEIAEIIPVALPDFLVTPLIRKKSGKFTSRNVPVLVHTSARIITSSLLTVKKTLKASLVSIFPMPRRVSAKYIRPIGNIMIS